MGSRRNAVLVSAMPRQAILVRPSRGSGNGGRAVQPVVKIAVDGYVRAPCENDHAGPRDRGVNPSFSHVWVQCIGISTPLEARAPVPHRSGFGAGPVSGLGRSFVRAGIS
jgi:hypothetical protein